MIRAKHAVLNQRQGQSLVEFALVAPILLFLLVGVAQVGALYFTQISVATAAREGARVAAANPGDTALFAGALPASLPTTATCNYPGSSLACQAVYASTRNGSFGGLIDQTKLNPVTLSAATYGSPAHCTGARGTSDGLVSVAVSYQAPVFIPLLTGVFADPGQNYRTVTSTVTIRVEPCESTNGN